MIDITDKVFWHKYNLFYDKYLNNFIPCSILEFGTANGHSATWLRDLFSHSLITSVDIDAKPNLPNIKNVKYIIGDHNDQNFLCNILSDGPYDLVIDDGSHLPSEQAGLLNFFSDKMPPQSIYICEDLQTNLSNHPLYAYDQKKYGIEFKSVFTTLTFCLLFRKFSRSGLSVDNFIATYVSNQTTYSYFSPNQIKTLFNKIDSVHIHRRVDFPDICWSCGSDIFLFGEYLCKCGTDIFLNEADSITSIIKFK